MTNTAITCTCVGVHRDALTRGHKYEIVTRDDAKGQVQVRGDNHRTRWYPINYFDFTGAEAPVLAKWWFCDPVIDEPNSRNELVNCVDVGFELSSGELRWCIFVTPDYLKQLLEARNDPNAGYEPGIYGTHLVIVADLAHHTVDWMLRHMDQQGELAEHSILTEPSVGDIDDE
ncbi:MAG: hypothetical protein ABIY70_08040 [Capsulimonas sp.]|uniref:hypothetical protein n=1 Tax=Capsulimonas sp. TaxID=2494211 RepID=UPI003265D34B